MRQHLLCMILVLCCPWCSGQLHNSFSVRGEVQHDPGQRVDDLYVELYEQDRHMLVEKVAVSFDGQFEIRQASAGNYEIRLVDRLGNAIRSEYTRLNGDGQPLTFRFTRERPKVPGGPVSLSALRHGENRKAMREFHLAAKATAKGDIASSVTHLNKSIVLDPDYAPAHNQLGLIFATLGDQENSLLEFKKTVALDSSLVIPHGNLAIALFRTDRLGEAEAEARKAIQLDSNYAKGHYVLALCLLRQHKYGKETLAQLRQASEAFPQARVLVEKLEAAVGREVVPELSAPRPLR